MKAKRVPESISTRELQVGMRKHLPEKTGGVHLPQKGVYRRNRDKRQWQRDW